MTTEAHAHMNSCDNSKFMQLYIYTSPCRLYAQRHYVKKLPHNAEPEARKSAHHILSTIGANVFCPFVGLGLVAGQPKLV